MADQGSTPSTTPASPTDWREQRRLERLARHEARWHRHGARPFGWIGGAFLVLLGILLLLQNLGFPFLTNWWALFILIPAFWSYTAAWEMYQDQGRLTRSAAGSLTAAILMTALTFIFLLNLAFGIFWPVLLIVGGVALLVTGLVPQ
jgi:hypothetical protein